MQLTENHISNIEIKIIEHKLAIKRLYKLIPLGLLAGLILSFLYPFIPRKRNRILEYLEYQWAVATIFIGYLIIYSIGLYFAVNKRSKSINELERELMQTKEMINK